MFIWIILLCSVTLLQFVQSISQGEGKEIEGKTSGRNTGQVFLSFTLLHLGCLIT